MDLAGRKAETGGGRLGPPWVVSQSFLSTVEFSVTAREVAFNVFEDGWHSLSKLLLLLEFEGIRTKIRQANTSLQGRWVKVKRPPIVREIESDVPTRWLILRRMLGNY